MANSRSELLATSTKTARCPIKTTSQTIISRRPNMLVHAKLRKAASGYTLAELMVVVVIMITLVAITLPIAKKVMDDSHVREATRVLHSYFAMAQARAA